MCTGTLPELEVRSPGPGGQQQPGGGGAGTAGGATSVAAPRHALRLLTPHASGTSWELVVNAPYKDCFIQTNNYDNNYERIVSSLDVLRL